VKRLLFMVLLMGLLTAPAEAANWVTVVQTPNIVAQQDTDSIVVNRAAKTLVGSYRTFIKDSGRVVSQISIKIPSRWTVHDKSCALDKAGTLIGCETIRGGFVPRPGTPIHQIVEAMISSAK
jgi:hypothetical protein